MGMKMRSSPFGREGKASVEGSGMYALLFSLNMQLSPDNIFNVAEPVHQVCAYIPSPCLCT